MGSDKDGVLHKRAQPRQPAQRSVLLLERRQVEPELEQPRQPVERQRSRRASLSVRSFCNPFFFGRDLRLRINIFLPAAEHFTNAIYRIH